MSLHNVGAQFCTTNSGLSVFHGEIILSVPTSSCHEANKGSTCSRWISSLVMGQASRHTRTRLYAPVSIPTRPVTIKASSAHPTLYPQLFQNKNENIACVMYGLQKNRSPMRTIVNIYVILFWKTENKIQPGINRSFVPYSLIRHIIQLYEAFVAKLYNPFA